MIPTQNNPHGTEFYVMCPGENERYHKLMISHDGSVNRNLKYNDVCTASKIDSEQEFIRINIAYNNRPGWFEVDDDTQTMVEYPLYHMISRSKEYSYVSFTWEILKFFFKHNNIIPNWLNCHWNWGWFDEEKGEWTGAMGKVWNLHTFIKT